jgi:hypothetical protein
VTIRRYAFALCLLAFLVAACGSATPETEASRPDLPTPNVPPRTDIDMAIERWEKSNTTRYYAEIEEHALEASWRIRLVVADGQIRAAQRLEKEDSGTWGEPVALPLEAAQAYTMDALLARVRRDAIGAGQAPVNLRVAFDASLGFPAVVHAEALPSYDDAGKVVLNRQHSYDLTVALKALLEDTFPVNQEPILTLIRSGGPEAWCDHLRIFEDGSSAYADDCQQTFLELDLPESQVKALQDLRSGFASLDDVRQEGGQSQQLSIIGTGEDAADPATIQTAWDLSVEAHAQLSKPIGLGLTMGYVQKGELFGFDVFNQQALPAEVTIQGEVRGAAISPDGKYLAFSDDAGLRAMEIASGEVDLLLPSPELGYYQPRSWSNAGHLLLIHIPETDGDPYQHGWLSLEDKAWHDLPAPEGTNGYGCDTGASWAPQASQLVITGLEYGSPCNASAGLILVDVESGEAQRIVAPTVNSGVEGGESVIAGGHTPAWSPDGNWIAFGLDQDAESPLAFPTRLYRVHPDGSQLTPLTNNSQGSAAHPAWAPDGSLYYSLSGASAETDGIYRYYPGDNTHTLLIPGSDLHPISVSPEGGFMLYEQNGELKIWDIRLDEIYAVISGEAGSLPGFTGWLQIEH